MKSKKTDDRSSNFHLAYIFLVLFFVAGITFLALSMFLPKKQNSDDDALSTTVNTTEQTSSSTSTSASDPAADKTPKQNEDGSDAAPDSINASITMNKISGEKYMLRITIYELLDSGSCELYMENSNGSSVKRTAKIIATGADSSSCEGFDIAKSGIEGGTYDFTVKLTSGEKSNTLKGVIKI